MPLDTEQKLILAEIGSQLLKILDEVSKQAQSKLSGGLSQPPRQSLASTNNTMVGSVDPRRNLNAIYWQTQESLRRIQREPFVARVVVRWENDEPAREETLYISRASVAGMSDENIGGRLVTYTTPIGQLAEYEAGESATILIGRRRREVSIKERIRLRPERRDEQWDAVKDRFEFEDWRIAIESVLQFLQQMPPPSIGAEDIPDLLGTLFQQGVESKLVSEKLKREVLDRITLRDAPILDRFQGEVFRMPLDQRLVLLGPPGTGKTTTLIRRLAQKRTPDGLTDEESETLLTAGLSESFRYSDSWAMFSPTELLKLYLRDAFNREGVPARDNNLRTWDKERLFLGKNVLGILRSAESWRFQLDENAPLLADTSSDGVQKLYEEFAPYFETLVLDRCTEAFEQIQLSEDWGLQGRVMAAIGQRRGEGRLSVREIANLLEQASELQPEVKRLNDEIEKELRVLGNQLLYSHPELLAELCEALPLLANDARRDEEEEEEEEVEDDTVAQQHKEPRSTEEERQIAAGILLDALRRQALALATGRSAVSGRAGRVIGFLGDRLPEPDSLSLLGGRIGTRAHLRTLTQSPRLYVMGAPQAYARFRRLALKEQRLFNLDGGDAVKQMRISPGETDVLILTMLRNARRLLDQPPLRLAHVSLPDWLENIRSQYLMQVFVDEATDFSAVQLACTMELSHPRLRSWFACGDLNQRITSYGIRDRAQIEWLERMGGDSVEVMGINIPYRQSRRLEELAIALSTQTTTGSIGIKVPEQGEDADVWPLLAEFHGGDRLAHWLTERISEVERTIGKLPSIAIFVKDEASIDPLVQAIQPLLAERNILVVGCKEGRVVGDNLEVRVFDVKHIKGLEFEAVFFVGIDQLAERLPDLFDRFFYVGVSRAATYLGVTCERSLPVNLEPIRGHFVTGGWTI